MVPASRLCDQDEWRNGGRCGSRAAARRPGPARLGSASIRIRRASTVRPLLPTTSEFSCRIGFLCIFWDGSAGFPRGHRCASLAQARFRRAVPHSAPCAPDATVRRMADRPAGRRPAATGRACRAGNARSPHVAGWRSGRPGLAGPPVAPQMGAVHTAPQALLGGAKELLDDVVGAVHTTCGARPASSRATGWPVSPSP